MLGPPLATRAQASFARASAAQAGSGIDINMGRAQPDSVAPYLRLPAASYTELAWPDQRSSAHASASAPHGSAIACSQNATAATQPHLAWGPVWPPGAALPMTARRHSATAQMRLPKSTLHRACVGRQRCTPPDGAFAPSHSATGAARQPLASGVRSAAAKHRPGQRVGPQLKCRCCRSAAYHLEQPGRRSPAHDSTPAHGLSATAVFSSMLLRACVAR